MKLVARARVVSTNGATRDALCAYLHEAGFAASSSHELPADEALDVVVVFPDDYPEDWIRRELAALHERQAARLIVIVTSQAATYARGLDDEAQRPYAVIPKPAWGWTIVDAIRELLAV